MLRQLVSSRDVVPEMAGRNGYVYTIRLEGNAIFTSAYPTTGEQLPALYTSASGPGVARVLAKLQRQHFKALSENL